MHELYPGDGYKFTQWGQHLYCRYVCLVIARAARLLNLVRFKVIPSSVNITPYTTWRMTRLGLLRRYEGEIMINHTKHSL